MLISVSKDVSYRVTGNEVSDTTLLSAVRRFSQFCDTQTRERVTIAICQIIIQFVKSVCKIHVMVTCKNNTICKTSKTLVPHRCDAVLH